MPIVAFVFLVFLCFAVVRSDFAPSLCIAWLWLTFGFIHLFKSARARRTVWLEGKELIISDRSGEERIPLSLVSSVTESRFSREKTITVKWLKRPDLLEKITFFAAWEPHQIPFTDHPVVKRLRQLKGDADQP